jgi:hypothetical protein
MKYLYANERDLWDGLRCRMLENSFSCHPTAAFDKVQILLSVSRRIKD